MDKSQSPLTLFKAERDTTEIARILNITEAQAYNDLSRERELSRKTLHLREYHREWQRRNRNAERET